MGRVQLVRSRALAKRMRQLAYLCLHPLSHYRCVAIIRDARLAADRLIPLKYLGDHLSLSLHTPKRRQALMGHYAAMPKLLRLAVRRRLRKGILLWHKDVPDDSPPLRIVLEPSRLAPMEGELQLTFSFRTELFVLTFLLAPGSVFDVDAEEVLFIGGVQGRIGSREEMREAAKLNGEISPAAMLILAVQAFAKVTGVDRIIAIGERDHISVAYSPSKILFDYRRFWTEIGGERFGRYYRIPFETRHKPLSEIPLTHRGRTKRKREAKNLIRQSLERRLKHIFADAVPLIRPEPCAAARIGAKPEPAFS